MPPPKEAPTNGHEYARLVKEREQSELRDWLIRQNRAAQAKLRRLDLDAYERETREKAAVVALRARVKRLVAWGRANPMTEADYAVWGRIKPLCRAVRFGGDE